MIGLHRRWALGWLVTGGACFSGPLATVKGGEEKWSRAHTARSRLCRSGRRSWSRGGPVVRDGLGHQTSAFATAVTKVTYRGGAVDVGGVFE